MTSTPQQELEHATRLLALELTDGKLEALRAEFGNTNVAVLKHWRNEVFRLLKAGATPEDASPRQVFQQENVTASLTASLRAKIEKAWDAGWKASSASQRYREADVLALLDKPTETR